MPGVVKMASDGEKVYGRHQMAITAGPDGMNVRDVNRQLKQARLANPGSVLVVVMHGAFTNDSAEGLSLPGHTCVILNGKIWNTYEPKESDLFELISMKGKGCNSFSGGQVVSDQKVFAAISAADASNVLLIEDLSIDLHSEHGGVTVLNKKRESGLLLLDSGDPAAIAEKAMLAQCHPQ